MTLNDDHTETGHRNSGPEHTPRLRLKPKADQSGYVDGAWWPHSDDLTAELPDLLTVLSVRLGPIGRVVYGLHEWATAPGELVIGERTIRLDEDRIRPAHTVEVLGLNQQRLVLLVVSPDADAGQAHAVMMTAAGPHNALSVDSLLSTDSEAMEGRVSG